jgi:hypothetical protein
LLSPVDASADACYDFKGVDAALVFAVAANAVVIAF